MGLALSTGFLADMLAHDPEGAQWMRKNLVLLNELLGAQKLPLHNEPEQPGLVKPRAHVSSFPYSFLHYLRRAFARVREGLPVTPVVDGENPAKDRSIDEASSMFDAHLLCHSDCEGFYVPIDFSEVIFDVDKRGLPGGMLGSSVRLFSELAEVAPALGIKLENGQLSNEEAARLAVDDESAPFWREQMVWLALYENARVSLANKSLIVFS